MKIDYWKTKDFNKFNLIILELLEQVSPSCRFSTLQNKSSVCRQSSTKHLPAVGGYEIKLHVLNVQ